jgi:formate hydrogenlyase subunit 3/multisubunit Na+/H+ antiporter MnhD subunit
MVQTDFKKMLSYASIGQAGFMIVAVTTMSVIGTVAALIHMHAHVIYKSACSLFPEILKKRKVQRI